MNFQRVSGKLAANLVDFITARELTYDTEMAENLIWLASRFMKLGDKARGRHSAGLQAETLDDGRDPAERMDQRWRISALHEMGMLLTSR